MKLKTTSWLAVVFCFIIFVVVGCKNNQPKSEKPTETTKQETKKTQTPENKKQEEPQAKPEKTLEEMSRPNIIVTQHNIDIKWSDGSTTRMKATAKELVANEVNKNIVVNNFTGEFYEKGKLSAKISAKKAFIDGQSRTIIATDGVKISSTMRNTSVTASWIKWYSKQGKIVGNGGIKITSEMGTIEAPAFEADTTLEKFTVKNSGKGL